MDKRIRAAYIELTLAMVIVGSSVVIGKLIIASFPVFLASALRFGIASVVLVPLLLAKEGKNVVIGKRDWFILFLQAFTGVFLFSIFLLYGLKFTSAAEAGIITSTTPAVVGVISFLFLKEKLTFNKVVGIALAVCGVLLINVLGGVSDTERGPFSLFGNMLIFGAVVGEALFTIFRKLSSNIISPLRTATLMSLLGLAMFSPFALYEAVQFDFSGTTILDWIPVFYYGIVVTVIAFILWFQGVMKVSASVAGVFTGIMPVSAVLLSYMILGEAFAWSHLWGGLCVLVGIGFIVDRSSRRGDVTV